MTAFFLSGTIILISCEKEQDIATQPQNQLVKTNFTQNIKVAAKQKQAKRDSEGSLIECVPTPSDCAVFATLPNELALNGLFFDGDGSYIEESFENNYSIATSYFTQEEVDDVIAEINFVSQVQNDSLIFIAFQNVIDGNDVAVYQYGE